MIPSSFEFLINQAKEGYEDNYEIPEELANLLKQEDKIIQPHQEPVGVINLGTKENKKEVRVGASLNEEIKKRLVELLRE